MMMCLRCRWCGGDDVLTAVGKPVTANNPRIGSHRGDSGVTTPNIGFLLKYSKIDPTCHRPQATDHNYARKAKKVAKKQRTFATVVAAAALVDNIWSCNRLIVWWMTSMQDFIWANFQTFPGDSFKFKVKADTSLMHCTAAQIPIFRFILYLTHVRDAHSFVVYP